MTAHVLTGLLWAGTLALVWLLRATPLASAALTAAAATGTWLWHAHRTRRERAVQLAESDRVARRFEHFAQGAHAAIYEFDAEDGTLYVSPGFAANLGFAPERDKAPAGWVTGRLHPEDASRWTDAFPVDASGISSELDLRLRVPSGEYRWYHLRATLRRDGTGAVTQFLAILSDITTNRYAEQRLRESEESFRSLSAASPVGILKADGVGQCAYCNEQWQLLSGLSEFEAMGDGWFDAITEADRPRLRARWSEFIAIGGKFEDEFSLLSPGGERRWLHARGNTVLDELCAVTGFVVTFEDVTEQRLAAMALAEARDRAMQAAQAKSEFLANMSHEIRTPLNGVIGMTELLQTTALNDEQRDFVRTINTSADALLAIINDILDFSKIEAGKLNIEKVDLDVRELAEDVTELLALRARERGLELVLAVEPDVPRHLIGDPVRIRQILLNLATNAIKFSEQGEVTLGAECLAMQGDHCTLKLWVRDTGIGIRPDRLGAVFESFTQADGSTTRKYGGTGLGLTICRQLAQLMGGSIHVKSDYGSGSEFWVELPLLVADGSPQRFEVTCDLSGAHALVVDHHPLRRRLLVETLRGWGMRPESAESGQEAIAKVRHAGPDGYAVVLVEERLGGMGGPLAAAQLAALPGAGERAVVMLSPVGRTAPADAIVRQWVSRPVREETLHRTLCGVLGRVAPGGPTAVRLAEVEDFSDLALLLAEDNEVNRKVALRMFQRLGCSADVAVNGREALERSGERDYDLVFMDCQMPEMDGFEATRQIRLREQETGAHVRIVAMTANAMEGDRERCLDSGMDDYVPKPVKLEKIAEQLREAQDRRQRRAA